MRYALVVALVACSCGSITPVSTVDVRSGDAAADADAARGEVHLEAAAGELGGAGDASTEAPAPPPPACTMADTISAARCSTPGSLNGVECLRCYWNNTTAVAPTPCVVYAPVAPSGVGVCVRSCNDCAP